jgi:hypothetical protein
MVLISFYLIRVVALCSIAGCVALLSSFGNLLSKFEKLETPETKKKIHFSSCLSTFQFLLKIITLTVHHVLLKFE